MTEIRMSKRDKTTLFLLIFMSVFLYADQRIMSAILPELASEYKVSDVVLGYIGSAFTLVGAFMSILFGFFSDKTSRKKLLVLTVLIGEIPCFLTGIRFFTQNIYSFTILRILTGIGIGGIYPISFSLLSDYFKEEHRATAAAWLGVAWSIGMLVGPSLAGYLTNSYGWRMSFILAATPNFPLVLIFAFYAKDPKRGQTEEELQKLFKKGIEYNPRISFKDLKIIFSNKTNILTFLQGIFGTIPWGIIGYWLILFMQKVRGLSKEMATTIYLLLGIGATIGAIVFAYVAEKLYKKRPKYMPLLCGIGVLIGIIPAFLVLNIPINIVNGTEIIKFYILSFIAGFLVAVPSANVKAILMNVNRPEQRGSVFAIFNITDNLGQGFGPALGGLLMGFGFLFTMNFSIFWWLPCGIIFLLVALTFEKDREKLKKYLRERSEIVNSKI